MYKVPEEWKLSDFLELSNDEKLKWLYNGVKNGGGGSDLPEVTSDDNGDVLTVVNGEWNKATPSGSSDAFVVNFTLEDGDEMGAYTATCDKTFAEINAAYTANKTIYAWVYYTDAEQNMLSNSQVITDGEFMFSFDILLGPGSITKYIITINPESVNAYSYPIISSPLYLGSSYSSGDRLQATDLELYNTATLVFIGLFLADNDDNVGVFVFDGAGNIPYGYCFAGTPGAIGATATINSETGLITVTPPNS